MFYYAGFNRPSVDVRDPTEYLRDTCIHLISGGSECIVAFDFDELGYLSSRLYDAEATKGCPPTDDVVSSYVKSKGNNICSNGMIDFMALEKYLVRVGEFSVHRYYKCIPSSIVRYPCYLMV